MLDSFFNKITSPRIATIRAGNVIGGGDWAEDRIVPDCVQSWANEECVELRNPQTTRPWQHVLEPLSGYLVLAKELDQNKEIHGEPFNFGPPPQQNHSVLELAIQMAEHWDKVRWREVSKTSSLFLTSSWIGRFFFIPNFFDNFNSLSFLLPINMVLYPF